MGLSCFLLCVDEFLLCVLSLDCVEMYMGDFNPQHELRDVINASW